MDEQNYQQGGYQQPQQDVYQQPIQGGYQQPIQGGYQQPMQGYQQPMQGYQQPAFSKGPSVAALVCGILGIVGSFIPFVKYFTFICAVLGIIFGVVGQKKAKAVGVKSGLATAGLVLGIIGTVFGLAGVICAIACTGALAAAGSDFLY